MKKLLFSLFALCFGNLLGQVACNHGGDTIKKIFYPNSTTNVLIAQTFGLGSYLCGPNTFVYDTTNYNAVLDRNVFLNYGTKYVTALGYPAGNHHIFAKSTSTVIIKSYAPFHSYITYEPGATIIDQSGLCAPFTYTCSLITLPSVSCVDGINEVLFQKKTFILSPNPTSNILYISSIENDFKNSEIEIINYLGQTVLQLQFSKEIDVSKLTSGYYNLKIVTENKEFYYSKFIKE